jgi:hypothetical protein
MGQAFFFYGNLGDEKTKTNHDLLSFTVLRSKVDMDIK